MHNILKSLIKGNKLTLVLTALLAIFIVVDVTIPETLADLVDSIVGKSVVILVSVSLLGVDMLLGTLGIIAGYLLIQRSSNAGVNMALQTGENNKMKYLTSLNVFPMTVEEEVIASMLPRASPDYVKPSYKPTLNNLNNASNV